ncbi:hypothetical protein HOO65_010192 [Ceratocystis lukuohia]|uniref:Xylanolytic transcriptional activator regulatory domain-containing protein n=1 Tax=Ceratocystis lukuohia TaxID=2019550 RepID=A0ABR4MRC2_9PEZI
MPTNGLSSSVTMRPTPPAASTSKQEQAGQNGSHDDLRDTSSSASSPYGDGPGMVNGSASRHDRKKNTKQRRNKPTLSCFECVERKTKCDRGRPTCFAWGLPEVISVIPTKAQTDALMARYFECVDPVYPMIHRQTFYADYEHFWGMADVDRSDVDASFVALLFVMIAMGAQFVEDYPCAEKKNMAEFYASASHQSLRVYSYLSTASVTSIQAMVLITYFLINDNHVTDGWAFAGILTRQSYAMGLHRDPNIVTPNASLLEKQQRRKLWQAVLLQDTFLTILLSLPPTATHTDVTVDSLIEDGSSIANSDPTDTLYIKCSWTLANLVQESICSPRSLDLPICTTARHKTKLINEFKSVYRSFPDLFRCWDKATLTARKASEGRAVRQILWLTSNFFHNLMLVNASMSDEVSVNVRGTLEAAHDAITSFFLLFELFESEARMWWAFNHRAFLEALCIGAVLKMHAGDRENIDETIYDRGKNDLCKY